MQEWVDKILSSGLNLLCAGVILIVGRWLAHFLSGLTEQALKRTHIEAALIHFLKNLVYFALLTFVVIAALGKLGIQTASFVAVLGAAGFAVGMALQGSLSNFAAGVMILIFKPFRIGDAVTAGGFTGNVESIQIFNTVLHTPDHIQIIIPNSQITGGVVTNYSALGIRRVDLKFGVSYADDLSKVKKVITEVLNQNDLILAEPAAEIAVFALAESSVDFIVRPWAKTGDYWKVYFGVTESIKKAFDENDISMPFRQLDVVIKNGKLRTAD